MKDSGQRTEGKRGQRTQEEALARHPKPFIAWGAFMGLMTGGTFAVAGLAVPRGRGGSWSSLHGCRSPVPTGLHRLLVADGQRLTGR